MNRKEMCNYNQERNEAVRERYELAIERIAQIKEESILEEPYRTYFVKMSELLLKLDNVWKRVEEAHECQRSIGIGILLGDVLTQKEQKDWNQLLCNNNWAVEHFPENNPYKNVLKILCHEIKKKLADIYRMRLDLLTIDAELFLEIYSIFQDEVSVRQVEQAIYWHNSDYADMFAEDLVERILGIAPSYEQQVIKETILMSKYFDNEIEEEFYNYLYEYGETIQKKHFEIAHTYGMLFSYKVNEVVEFVLEQYLNYQNREDLQGKIIPVCYEKGFEFVVNALIQEFNKRGIEVVVCRLEDLCPELVYEQDEENSFWMNRQYKERRVQALRTQLEQYKEKTSKCLSPLVLYCESREDVKSEQIQNQKQKKAWNECFEQQDSILYSFIPNKTAIIL